MITRESDYAIRCILHLSENKDKLSSVKDISDPMEIPQSFLAKILQRLLKAGLVESIRGAGGGFKLAKTPEDISMLDVVKAIDGTISFNKCVDDEDFCELREDCVMHPIWRELSSDVELVLSKKDFKTLSEAYTSTRKQKRRI